MYRWVWWKGLDVDSVGVYGFIRRVLVKVEILIGNFDGVIVKSDFKVYWSVVRIFVVRRVRISYVLRFRDFGVDRCNNRFGIIDKSCISVDSCYVGWIEGDWRVLDCYRSYFNLLILSIIIDIYVGDIVRVYGGVEIFKVGDIIVIFSSICICNILVFCKVKCE